jgi:hypothetical protein
MLTEYALAEHQSLKLAAVTAEVSVHIPLPKSQ